MTHPMEGEDTQSVTLTPVDHCPPGGLHGDVEVDVESPETAEDIAEAGAEADDERTSGHRDDDEASVLSEWVEPSEHDSTEPLSQVEMEALEAAEAPLSSSSSTAPAAQPLSSSSTASGAVPGTLRFTTMRETMTTSVQTAYAVGTELDGQGLKGYLYMRDEGVTYHRMRRYYCRCMGVNFARFTSREAAHDAANATMLAEVLRCEPWDGRGLLHTYRFGFKIFFTNGDVFNVDADSEDDKQQWVAYIELALRGAQYALDRWTVAASPESDLLQFSIGGLAYADPKQQSNPPKFQKRPSCVHPSCTTRLDSASKRQHHCRNCGGTICSEHGSKFTPLRHYGMNTAVRVCFGCHRVQRFLLSLSIIVQRFSIACVEPPEKVAATNEKELQDMDAVQPLLDPEMVSGICDVIQFLHLFRQGADEAYAIAVNKLLDLAATDLSDFEFFLPQLFHLWLTMDWVSNTVKSAMLWRVICEAARSHIRFATSVYWLTRAAIDDSCGWGFGQSELVVPEFLFHRFSLCKLLMYNLEMMVQGHDWRFHPDQDLPASAVQNEMVTCQLQRLNMLLDAATLINKTTDRRRPALGYLGPLCDAISFMVLPVEYHFDYIIEPSNDDNIVRDPNPISTALGDNERRIFAAQVKFVNDLCEMTERLRMLAPENRKEALKSELETLELPLSAFSPIGTCKDALKRFIKIIRDEGTVFRTRARAPTLVFFEVEQLAASSEQCAWVRCIPEVTPLIESYPKSNGNEEVDTKLQIHGNIEEHDNACPYQLDCTTPRSEKNAVEMAATSAFAKAIGLDTFDDNGDDRFSDTHSLADSARGYSARSQSGGYDEDERDTEASQHQHSPHEHIDSRENFARHDSVMRASISRERHRTGSLIISSTAKSIDQIVAACTGRRKRSMSESSETAGKTGVRRGFRQLTRSQSSDSAFNDVEKFSQDQLFMMAKSLRSSASKRGLENEMSGEDIVSWMKQNEIVRDDDHALWLGAELLASGAIVRVLKTSLGNPNQSKRDYATFAATREARYRIRNDSSTPLSTPKAEDGRDSQASDRASDEVHEHIPLRIAPPKPPLSGNSRHSHSRHETHSVHPSSSRLMSPKHRRNRSTSSVTEALGVNVNLAAYTSPRDGQELLLPLSQQNAEDSNCHQTFIDRFKCNEVMSAVASLEQAMEQYVYNSDAGEDQIQHWQNDFQLLREELELVFEYVNDKRKERQQAVESAFGEPFEEKKERLRKCSQQALDLPYWDCVAFIVKSNDDLRQEVLCLQLIRQFQDIFSTSNLPLRLLPYGIIATSGSTGMIEYIKDATSLDALKKRPGYTTLAAHFEKTYGPPESRQYRTAMTNFVRSMAAYSLVCYFLQIKDRHNGNIMIDSEGHVVHIDYGFILGIAPGGRFSLETAPFKLTAEMVDAMGGTQSEYFRAFVVFLIEGFLAIQEHAQTILLMIAIMAQESSCPCFLSQNPRDILLATERRFRRDLDEDGVIKYVLRLVRRSHNSYRTRQYDRFQRISNGILP